MGFLDIFKKKQVKRTSNKREEEYGIQESSLDEERKYSEKFISSNNEIEELIIKEILMVVKNNGNFNELKAGAEIAAYNIGDKYIDLLPDYLSGKIRKPYELVDEYEEAGAWQMVVENSVLMIIFSYKEKGVGVLSKIAYGNTCLKLKAINLLVRLATEGVETDKIIDEIMNNIVDFNDEDKLTIFGFASRIKNNNKIIALIQHFYREFLKDEDVENAYQSLIYLIETAQRAAIGHMNFLRFIALDSKKIDLTKVIDVKEGEKDSFTIENINELTKIKAALTFYSINKGDGKINKKLIYWSENYNDLEVRNEIERVFENK